MSQIICQTTGLCKSYKNFQALQNVNLSIPCGEIYGLVGENGAGKSTLMRILTGLAYPSAGKVALFGKTDRLSKERAKIGCTVETPALYKDMTARQNLEIQRVQRGIPGKICIQRALELVGLFDAPNKKVRDFSLGMKQRLALAIALLGGPEFLILDEPVNGLDPTGIIELRRLLKKLAGKNHVTILISSHILGELNQLATCYGFLHHGKLLKQISARELSEECRRYIRLKTDDAKKAAAVLEERFQIKNFSVFPDGHIRIFEKLEEARSISKELCARRIAVEEMSVQGENLESYFEKLIGGGRHV